MYKTSINYLGLIALVALIIGGLTSSFGVGIILSIFGLIVTTFIYKKIDELGYGTKLFNFSIYQYLIALIPTLAMIYFGVQQYTNQSSGILALVLIILFALLIFLSILNYFIAKSLLLFASQTNNMWFKISGELTKFGAYTMPIILGFVLLVIAQPFFLIGCIVYNPSSVYKQQDLA